MISDLFFSEILINKHLHIAWFDCFPTVLPCIPTVFYTGFGVCFGTLRSSLSSRQFAYFLVFETEFGCCSGAGLLMAVLWISAGRILFGMCLLACRRIWAFCRPVWDCLLCCLWVKGFSFWRPVWLGKGFWTFLWGKDWSGTCLFRLSLGFTCFSTFSLLFYW